MTERKHLAVEANKNSIRYAMAGDKEAWLALYTDDAVVCDPWAADHYLADQIHVRMPWWGAAPAELVGRLD